MSIAVDEQQSATKKKRHKSKAALIKQAIHNFEEKLEQNDMKATFGDFIRLLQLEEDRKALVQPREVKVTWIEPKEEEPVSEK